MKLRINLTYSVIQTLSTYLVPLFVFPHISRVLGVDRIGMIDTVDNIIDYTILFSMMGMSTLGIREVARNNKDPEKLREVFSSLFLLNAIITLLAFVLLWMAYACIPQLQGKCLLLQIGSLKLIFNLFLVEWLFRGLERFQYITMRSVAVRTLFVVLVFGLVRTSNDYLIYYLLFVGIVLLNALCNWWHRRQIVSFSWRSVRTRKYIKSFMMLGLFAILSSIYTKLSVPVLNLMWGDTEAGYYTTSTRIYQVVIALMISLNSVMIPRISVLIEEGRIQDVRRLYKKSFRWLFGLSLPLIVIIEISAPYLIHLLCGIGFEGAILPLRIVILQVLVIGSEEIIILQLLIPLRQDKTIVISAALGVFVWFLLTLLLVPRCGAIGSAITWLAAEFTTLLVAMQAINNIKEMNYGRL